MYRTVSDAENTKWVTATVCSKVTKGATGEKYLTKQTITT